MAWIVIAVLSLIVIIAILKPVEAQEPAKSPGRCGTVVDTLGTSSDTAFVVLRYPTVAIQEPIPRSVDKSVTIGKSYLVKYTGGNLTSVTPVPDCSSYTLAQVRKGLLADRFAQKLDSILKPPR